MVSTDPPNALAVSVIPAVTGSISAICSSFIVAYILRNRLWRKTDSSPSPSSNHGSRRRGRARSAAANSRTSFHRIMVGLSFFDVMTSLSFAVASLPVPKGYPAPGAVWALGSIATCPAQGFFITLGLAGMHYNASLAIYFFCIILLHKSDEWIGKTIEKYLHAIPITLGVVGSILGFVFTAYNPLPSGSSCNVIAFPIECLYVPGVPCARGEHAQTLHYAFFVGPLCLSFVIIFCIMITIVVSVWKQERRMTRYGFSRTSFTSTTRRSFTSELRRSFTSELRDGRAGNSTPPISSRTNSDLSGDGRRGGSTKWSQTRAVSVQALAYIGSFFLTEVFPAILKAKQVMEQAAPTALIYLTMFFLPLQGFWNFLIFTQRYRAKWWASACSSRCCCCGWVRGPRGKDDRSPADEPARDVPLSGYDVKKGMGDEEEGPINIGDILGDVDFEEEEEEEKDDDEEDEEKKEKDTSTHPNKNPQ